MAYPLLKQVIASTALAGSMVVSGTSADDGTQDDVFRISPQTQACIEENRRSCGTQGYEFIPGSVIYNYRSAPNVSEPEVAVVELRRTQRNESCWPLKRIIGVSESRAHTIGVNFNAAMSTGAEVYAQAALLGNEVGAKAKVGFTYQVGGLATQTRNITRSDEIQIQVGRCSIVEIYTEYEIARASGDMDTAAATGYCIKYEDPFDSGFDIMVDRIHWECGAQTMTSDATGGDLLGNITPKFKGRITSCLEDCTEVFEEERPSARDLEDGTGQYR